MGIFYFLSPRVTRSVRYGLAARNRLDLYRPPTSEKAPPDDYPVIIYLTGAAPESPVSAIFATCGTHRARERENKP